MDIRELQRRMRNAQKGVKEDYIKSNNPKPNKDMSMRDMLGKMRKLDEANLFEVTRVNKATTVDQNREEEKMNNYFRDIELDIQFDSIEIYENSVIFTGSLSNGIEWVYTVTPDDQTSDVEIDYGNDFNADEENNKKSIEMIEAYYDQFYNYWTKNVFDKN